MKLYAIGDLHLSLDPATDKPMDVFGPAWADHDVRLRENWLETVTEEDIVILAGDLSWALKWEDAATDLAFIHNLPGRKICIKGNHDLWWHGITRMNLLYEDVTFLQNDCCEVGPWILCGSRGWTCPETEHFTEQDRRIYERELLRLRMSLTAGDKMRQETGKEIIGILHYPPTADNKQPSGFTALFEEFGVKDVVYGHLHGKDAFPKGFQGNLNGVRYQLISLDYVEARPVLLREERDCK